MFQGVELHLGLSSFVLKRCQSVFILVQTLENVLTFAENTTKLVKNIFKKKEEKTPFSRKTSFSCTVEPSQCIQTTRKYLQTFQGVQVGQG